MDHTAANLNQDAAVAGGLSWFSIVRLGFAQTALGAIVVLTTSTLNRVMIVELALPALLPGLLVGLHYAVQILRPRWGHGSDAGGRRTPWIIGGMLVLASGGALASLATAIMASSQIAGVALAVVAFILIGGGVGACGTSLLVLLATHVRPSRRAAAASIVWIMMIVGFVITAITAGILLDPFSAMRLVAVTSGVSLIAVLVTLLAVWGVERRTPPVVRQEGVENGRPKTPFRVALAQVWSEPQARLFTIFVFVSMLAYSMQDLILEPFAGLVFGMTPGESTKLAGVQHSGVLVGMLLVAFAGSLGSGSFKRFCAQMMEHFAARLRRVRGGGDRSLNAQSTTDNAAAFGQGAVAHLGQVPEPLTQQPPAGLKLSSLRTWTVLGCLASAVALAVLTMSGHFADSFPLRPAVFMLGLANGAFAVAAIGSMMGLASAGRSSREGVRMGLWGAAQAIAFGLGGLIGAAGVDVMRAMAASPVIAYGTVFAIEGLLFLAAAVIALRIGATAVDNKRIDTMAAGQKLAENG
ncbi:MAG: BCD family MFS transporter [Pseudomonadota bacterium]